MNIITEITPNPETLKFIVDTQLLNSKGVEFKNSNNIKKNKFVQDFFSLDGIESIFVGPNFISVTKKNKITWGQLKPKILTFLSVFLNSHKIIIGEQKTKKDTSNEIDPQDKMSQKIKDIIDSKVRPAVAKDGGDIIFMNYKNGVVFLKLKGACSGCPSSTATLKQGIENLLQHYFPEIQSVQAIN